MAFLQGNLTLFMIGRSLLLHLPHSSSFFLRVALTSLCYIKIHKASLRAFEKTSADVKWWDSSTWSDLIRWIMSLILPS
jgi:hypothetical protein